MSQEDSLVSTPFGVIRATGNEEFHIRMSNLSGEDRRIEKNFCIATLEEDFFFFCQWALTLPPCFHKEATSALWLTSLGAPPDCRKDRTRLGEGFARLVLPEDITGKLWPC